MTDFDYKKIDDLLHSRIRLAVISLLSGVEEADFTFLKRSVGATDGNINSHLKKLEEARYIHVKKVFINRKPVTYYSLTDEGDKAFRDYIKQISGFLQYGEDK